MLGFLLKRLVATAAVCVLAACASTKSLPLLNENLRSSLGTVGVITVGPAVGGQADGPFGFGDHESSLVGTGAGLQAALLCGPGFVICALAFAPIGLFAGIEAEKEIEKDNSRIESALNRAMENRDLQADLRHAVVRYTGSADARIDLGTGATEPASAPDYTSMASSGIDSVLEVSLTQLALARKKHPRAAW